MSERKATCLVVLGGTVSILLLQACTSAAKIAPADRVQSAMTPASLPAPEAAAAGAPTPIPARGESRTSAGWQLTEQDRTVKAGMQRWAHESGWRLLWELAVDYPIEAPASFEGNFEQAVAALMRDMGHADIPPRAILYRGNQVVRIVARGME